MNLSSEQIAALENTGQRRFSEADVRANPTLLAQAVEYLATYHGDWEPLVAARLMATATGTLSVPVAKLVLNTMRSNPAARWSAGAVPVHPSAGNLPLIEQTLNDASRLEHSFQRREVLRVVDDREAEILAAPPWQRSYRREGSTFTKGRVSSHFVISTYKPADRRVFHVIDHARTLAEWRDGAMVGLWVAKTCEQPNRGGIRFPTDGFELATLPDERTVCRSCIRVMDERRIDGR